MLCRSDLHEYQKDAVAFAKERRRAGLFLSPGLGKTIISLTLISEALGEDRTPWLVVCPLRVVNTWVSEIERWFHTLHLKPVVVHGRGKSELLRTPADVYLINYEGLPWLYNELRGTRGVNAPFNNLILDESHKIKSPTAKRWKLLKKMLPMFDHRILLTGTPASNGLLGVWTQQFVIDEGAALHDRFNTYKHRYFYPVDFQGFNWQPVEGAEERIREEMRPTSISMRHIDHLTMPELTRNLIEVSLPSAVMQQYRELQKEFFLQVEDGVVHPANAAVVANKLRQIVQGGVYLEGGDWNELHNTKLEALVALIEELQGSPLLCLYQFNGELEMVTNELYKQKISYAVLNGDTGPQESKDIIDAWNADEISVLMAHPKTVSLGLNLQHGTAHNICWYSLTWSLDDFQQSEARLWRQGQRRTVIVHSILAKGTIDKTVLYALAGKNRTQKALLDALKHSRREHVL